MLWKIALTIITNILAVLGYLFLYWSDKQRLKRYKKWLLAGIILTSVTIWGNLVREIKESDSKAREFAVIKSNFNEIKTQNESMGEQIQLLLGVNDSLKTKLTEIENGNQKLTALLEPFITRARSEYPGWSDQDALQKLASDVSKMQPKLIFLRQTEPRRDSTTNLIQTVYVFRSKPTTALRDVQIRIGFDGRFVSITGRRTGAIGIGQEQMTPDQDSTGFYYATGYLHETNDIEIKVISKSILKILSMSLWPDPDK